MAVFYPPVPLCLESCLGFRSSDYLKIPILDFPSLSWCSVVIHVSKLWWAELWSPKDVYLPVPRTHECHQYCKEILDM